MSEFLKNYYENYDENGRLETKYGMVEFLTTMRYIEKYLKPGARILEVGAGTGRYSHALAQMGYEVDSVELVQHNIEIFKTNTKTGEKITVVQGDARDLSAFDDNTYDITLVLGPMYHLYNMEDKRSAVSEALRTTKTDGVVFVAYCITDANIIEAGFKRGLIHEFIEKNMLDTTHFKAVSTPADIFELHRKEDIDEIMSAFNVERLHYVASDGMARHLMYSLEPQMDDVIFDIYLKYHFATCERADMVGYSHHALDIFKKK